MNKLERPTYDDDAALDALAGNPLLGSHPTLQSHVATLKAAYVQYVAASGDVRAVAPVVLPVTIATHLRGHYGSPPKALSHIAEIRVRSDSNTCPMCGSLHSGTLDHVMDKEDHPAFSIFSQNLVPACKCNSKRLKPLVGPNPGERILHPYFDEVLSERIVVGYFTDLGPVPRIETRIAIDPLSQYYAAASFHHDSVIMRTGIRGYLLSRWTKLILKPWLIVPDLRINPIDRDNLASIIVDERVRNDEARDSKNNWDSVFLSGLLDDHVIDWLYNQLTKPGRLPNGPLL